MSDKTQVPVSTRELKIWYSIDGKSADEIAEVISEKHGVACAGDDVVALLKERKVQTRAIRRSEKSFVFVDPDNQVMEESPVEDNHASNEHSLEGTPFENFENSAENSI
jgi:hypothetical protein